MNYQLDLARLSVQEYRELLTKQNLLPGRKVLWQDIRQNFALLEGQGIHTLAQLKKALSTPAKIAALAACGIPQEYLAILKRELGSLEQKPVPLASFPGVAPSLIAELQKAGLKTSKDYFERGQAQGEELSCLCHLVRINGVGPAAAKAFYEAGYRSVADVAGADPAAMLERVSAANEGQRYYKAKLGEKDMRFCVDFAALLMKYGA